MNLLSSSTALQARRTGTALQHAELTTAGMFAIELLPRPGAPES